MRPPRLLRGRGAGAAGPAGLAVLLALAALLAPGCAQRGVTVARSSPQTLTYRERLDALYPPGALHTAARGFDAERLDTIRIPEGAAPEAVRGPAHRRFLRAALGELRAEGRGPVAGFDRYERLERPEAGDAAAPASPRRVCDLVFFGPEGRILRAYRRFAPCRREAPEEPPGG